MDTAEGGWELALGGLEGAADVIGPLLETRGAEVDVDDAGELFARFDGTPDLLVMDALGAWLDGLRMDDVALRTRRLDAAGRGEWQEGWRAVFTATQLSPRLWVRPVWEASVPGRTEVIIDPTRAFGAGFHPTTSACMAELDRAIGDSAGITVLDVGTGTGILAIAAAHLGADVVGVEIDAVACIDADRNAALNGVAERIRVRHGSLELLETPATDLPRVYDLVVANVLGPILVKLAPGIIPATGRALILSGIMLEREPEVLEAYPGFAIVARVEVRGWVTLHLQRI